MSPVSKVQAALANTDELALCSSVELTCFFGLLSHVVEAQTIELFRIGVEVRVVGDGVVGDFDDSSGRDLLARRQGEWLQDLAFKRGNSQGVDAHRFLEEAVQLLHGLEGRTGKNASSLGQDGTDLVPQLWDVLGVCGEVVESDAS